MFVRILRLLALALVAWLFWYWVRRLLLENANIEALPGGAPVRHLLNQRATAEPVMPASAPAQAEPAPPAPAASATELAPTPAAPAATPAPESMDQAEVSAAAPANDAEVIGYCARCRQTRTMADPRAEITPRGRRAARGHCSVCGARMYTWLPSDDTGAA